MGIADIKNSCCKDRQMTAVGSARSGKIAAGEPQRHRPLLSRRGRRRRLPEDKTPLEAAGLIDRIEGISITERSGVPEPGNGNDDFGARQDAEPVSRSSWRSLCITALPNRPGPAGQPPQLGKTTA